MRPSDVDAVVGLVHELASYENAPLECRLTAERLRAALFGAAPALFGHVVETGGQVVGCALWFLNFSTWRGVHGIYLEDLVVSQQHRGSGLGKALLAALAQECIHRDLGRLEWWVLDWNPATEFYTALGAEAMNEWTVYRLADEPLRQLAAELP